MKQRRDEGFVRSELDDSHFVVAVIVASCWVSFSAGTYQTLITPHGASSIDHRHRHPAGIPRTSTRTRTPAISAAVRDDERYTVARR